MVFVFSDQTVFFVLLLARLSAGDQVVELIGFGAFQLKLLIVSGLIWITDAMEVRRAAAARERRLRSPALAHLRSLWS